MAFAKDSRDASSTGRLFVGLFLLFLLGLAPH